MSDLKAEQLRSVVNGMDIAGIHPSLKALCDAASRYLALVDPTDEMIVDALRGWHSTRGTDAEKMRAALIAFVGLVEGPYNEEG